MNRINEKVLIYPYGREFAPVIRNRSLLGKYDIVDLISPPGWGMEGRDASCADRGPDMGILVHCDFEKSIEKCDTVLVADCSIDQDFRRTIYKNIDFALENRKNIICTIELEDEYLADIRKICFSKNVYFKYYSKYSGINMKEYAAEKVGFLDEIAVPVVFIGGVSENTSKFETQLSLRSIMLEKGYKVSQIGSRHYCELFSFHSFPGFVFETGLSDSQKIIMFNHYVKSIENSERPNIILIGIPGELTLFDNRFPSNFGEVAFLISNAVRPDFFILSVLYMEGLEQLNIIKPLIENKTGFYINCINMSNAQFDLSESIEKKKKCYNFLPHNFVDNRINTFVKTDIPLNNILNKHGREEMSRLLIDTLSDYCVSENICIGGI